MGKTHLKQFWMSFCDPDLPNGTQFLGAIVTEGIDIRDAIVRTHFLKINPGGEIQIHESKKGSIKSEHMVIFEPPILL